MINNNNCPLIVYDVSKSFIFLLAIGDFLMMALTYLPVIKA